MMVFEKNDLKYCRSNYRLNISPPSKSLNFVYSKQTQSPNVSRSISLMWPNNYWLAKFCGERAARMEQTTRHDYKAEPLIYTHDK